MDEYDHQEKVETNKTINTNTQKVLRVIGRVLKWLPTTSNYKTASIAAVIYFTISVARESFHPTSSSAIVSEVSAGRIGDAHTSALFRQGWFPSNYISDEMAVVVPTN